MELGGKSPQIMFADADIAKAAPALVNAIIQNGGQTCSAGSRVLVERPIYEAVASELSTRFSALVAGPHDADRDLGALINARQQTRVAAMVAEAEAAGAKVLARGSIAGDAPAGGHYFAPVLFGDVDPQAAIGTGRSVRSGAGAVCLRHRRRGDRAGQFGTPYGLVAGIWTKDGARQHRVAKQVRAGQVFVNAYGAGGGVELAVRRLRQVGPRPREGF